MASKPHRGQRGATLVEFTVALPVVLSLTFGLIDIGLVLFTWAEGNRATQAGARHASVNAPVATGLNRVIAPSGSTFNGRACFDAKKGTTTSQCAVPPAYTCGVNANGVGSCSSSSGTLPFDGTGFDGLVAAMQRQFLSRPLDKRQVTVTYTPQGLGYVGRPDTPMDVTVSLRCMKQQLFFLDALFGWAFPPLPVSCGNIASPNGFALPAFTTTVTGEDLGRLPGEG